MGWVTFALLCGALLPLGCGINATVLGWGVSCHDGLQDGDETGVDCGGSACTHCPGEADASVSVDATVDAPEGATEGGSDAGVDATPPDGSAGDVGVNSLDTGAGEVGTALCVAGGSPGMPDATDTPQLPEGGCGGGYVCNGVCAPDCRGCPGALLECRSTAACVSSCTSCPMLPVECFACDSNRVNALGSCEPNDPSVYCMSDIYATAYLDGGKGYHCACSSADASACPGETQVCSADYDGSCFTCGEIYETTSGKTCRNGATCQAP